MNRRNAWCLTALFFAAPLAAGSLAAANPLTLTASADNWLSGRRRTVRPSLPWGGPRRPEIQRIAVSRDLLQMGLTRAAEVEIDGLSRSGRVVDERTRRRAERIGSQMDGQSERAQGWGVLEVRSHC